MRINKVFSVGFTVAVLSAPAAVAGTELASPAFVQQASGSAGFSNLDTAAVMKPFMELIVATPSVDTSSLAGNLAFTYQSGDFNTASIQQSGTRNVGLIHQIGYMNAAAITQAGTGHQAFIQQQGRNNKAIINQR
jgi:minor curlin subunit